MPGARVTLTEANTGVARTTTTASSGNYSFPNLQPGKYTVSVEQQGFQKATREKIDVTVNSTVRVDLALQPGSINETITVSAATPPLKTDRADTGRTIEVRTLEDLPVGAQRQFQTLTNLVPGTTRAFRPHSEFFNPQNALSTQVNGQSRLANNLQEPTCAAFETTCCKPKPSVLAASSGTAKTRPRLKRQIQQCLRAMPIPLQVSCSMFLVIPGGTCRLSFRHTGLISSSPISMTNGW